MRMPATAIAGILLLGATTAHAQGPLQAAASTRATAVVTLAVPGVPAAEAGPPRLIRLDYGQPHLRGRTLHVDSLVPFDTPWRLGANAATTLHTDVELELGGTTLAAGSYVLEALPTRTAWHLIVQRVTGTNAEGENMLAEVARVPLRHRVLHEPVESLSMWLIPSREPGPARGELRFAWGTDGLAVGWVVR